MERNSSALLACAPEVRRGVRVRGQVQGVGFRPFVHRLATELALAGWVRNDGEGVEIEVQGPQPQVEEMLRRLAREAPALARVSAIEARERVPQRAVAGFAILASAAGPMHAHATPDTGTCPDCLRELFDPRDRRYRYPFVNCTQCGPRYTITRDLPYDRAQTSMAAFPQCPACLREYGDAADRRFHAEPNACPACGPRLWLSAPGGGRIQVDDVIAEALARLRHGEILALKGLGGFHLACDARDREAVARLRARKQREEKPFAVMLANPASIGEFAEFGEAEAELLRSPQRPVVLLRKRPGCDDDLPGVAPGLAWVGAMLAYTPLHWLLFHEAAGRPADTDWIEQTQSLCLVMTSANPGGEPLVTGNEEALRRLAGIADGFVMHDRDIVTRCDDSVMRIAAAPRFVRRARGFTPQAIPLARGGPSVLACGPYLKNTVCLTRGDEAFVSQHIGDLDNGPSCAALEQTVERLMELLQVTPEIVAHDLHPDFFSSRFATAFAQERALPRVAVQHHHAHIAAVIAEHRLEGELLGLALDGVGLGLGGGAWGGELLRASAAGFERIGHLREIGLPGGDRAAREPWRMGAAVLHELGRNGEIPERFAAQRAAAAVAKMLESGRLAPPTTSAGRWFDAAAGLVGVKPVAAFEGQAAMLLEGLAQRHGQAAPLADGFALQEDGTLDLLPLLARLTGEKDAAYGAALFHATLAAALACWVLRAAGSSGLDRVALGGGCFLNHVLGCELRAILEREGLNVFEARQVPPNDGGVSLGQAWVAMNSVQ